MDIPRIRNEDYAYIHELIKEGRSRDHLQLMELFGKDFMLRQIHLWAVVIIDRKDDPSYYLRQLVRMNALTNIGTWKDSPQGHRFWGTMEKFLAYKDVEGDRARELYEEWVETIYQLAK